MGSLKCVHFDRLTILNNYSCFYVFFLSRSATFKFIFPGDRRLPVDSVSCVSNNLVGKAELKYSVKFFFDFKIFINFLCVILLNISSRSVQTLEHINA